MLQYNMALSLKRAESVKNLLVKMGLEKSKINVSGRGPMEPLESEKTPEAYAKNRRVELRINGVADDDIADLKKKIEQIWPQ